MVPPEMLRKEVPDSILLSMLDRQTEGDLTAEEFEDRLVHHVLFTPRLYAPDIFFFISGHLGKHLRRPGRLPGESLFARAVKQNLIVPAFRDADPERWTFADAYEKLKDQAAVRREDAQLLVNGMRGWKGTEKGAAYFSPEVAEMLLDYLEKYCGREVGEHLNGLGEAGDAEGSRSLIARGQEYLAETLASARRYLGAKKQEMTRAAVLRAIGERKRLKREVWQDSQHLIASHDDGNERRVVKFSLGVVNACYQAAVAKVAKSRPEYSEWTRAEKTVLAMVRAKGEVRNRLTHTVTIPNYRVLRGCEQQLIGAREEHGRDYINCVGEWMKGTPGVDETLVKDRLEEYARRLRELYPRPDGGALMTLVLTRSGWGGLSASAYELAVKHILPAASQGGSFGPEAVVGAAVGGAVTAGSVAYTLWAHTRKVEVEMVRPSVAPGLD